MAEPIRNSGFYPISFLGGEQARRAVRAPIRYFPLIIPPHKQCRDIMFETICALPLSSELFTPAIHPSEPIVAVGLSGGHVQSFRLPAVSPNSDDEDGTASVLSTGTGTIETEWRTRRHKGSCRCLGYSGNGEGKVQLLANSRIDPVNRTPCTHSPLLSWHRLSPQSRFFQHRASYCQTRHPPLDRRLYARPANPPTRAVPSNPSPRNRLRSTTSLRPPLAYILHISETSTNSPST